MFSISLFSTLIRRSIFLLPNTNVLSTVYSVYTHYTVTTIDHVGENVGKLKKVIGLPPKSNRLVPGPGPRFASEKCRVQIVQALAA